MLTQTNQMLTMLSPQILPLLPLYKLMQLTKTNLIADAAIAVVQADVDQNESMLTLLLPLYKLMLKNELTCYVAIAVDKLMLTKRMMLPLLLRTADVIKMNQMLTRLLCWADVDQNESDADAAIALCCRKLMWTKRIRC